MTANLIILAAALAVALLSAYLVVLARETAEAWRRRIIIATALLPVALVALATAFQVGLPWEVMLGAGVVALLVLRRSGRSSALITRWARQQIRKKGVASPLDIVRFGSAAAMRRTTAVIRPSMAGLTRWQRARAKTTEVAVPLARAGGLHVYSSLRDVVTIFGAPGVGKTGWLAGRVIDHPGAVVTTSTRTDLMDITRPLREKRGPVGVFNPGGVGGLPSTVTFPPLTGCSDPVTATERATDMIPESEGAGDHGYWEGQAQRVLAALMHAAALGGRDMHDVQRWVARPAENSPEVSSLLRRSSEPAFEVDFAQFYGTNDKTLTSITSSITPALRWLTTPSAVAATRPGQAFDVSTLLREQGTVYMLGRHEAHTSPLLAALTGYIAREGRRLAAHQPRGRLDPPLGLFLDEAARVAPVPLPDWSGDFGGSGIFICAAFQSRADLIDRWGKTGAAKIINNSGAVVLFGGTKDAEDLDQWSKLAGDRDEVVVTYGKHGRPVARTVRPKPVLSPAQLACLPKFRVVVFRRDLRPAIGRVSMAWRRWDVRQPLWWRLATRARRVLSPARPGVVLPPPTRVSPALPGAVALSPTQSPAREVTRAG